MKLLFIGLFFSLILTFVILFIVRRNNLKPSAGKRRHPDNVRRKGEVTEIHTTMGIPIIVNSNTDQTVTTSHSVVPISANPFHSTDAEKV